MALIIVFPAPEWNAAGQPGYKGVSGGLVYPPYEQLAAEAAEIIDGHWGELGDPWGQNCNPPHIIVRKISDPNAISPEDQIPDPAEIIVGELSNYFASDERPGWIRDQLQDGGIAVEKSLPFCPETYAPNHKTALTYGTIIWVPDFRIAGERRYSLTEIVLEPNQLLVFSSEAGKLTLSENIDLFTNPNDYEKEKQKSSTSKPVTSKPVGVIYTFSLEELKAR